MEAVGYIFSRQIGKLFTQLINPFDAQVAIYNCIEPLNGSALCTTCVVTRQS